MHEPEKFIELRLPCSGLRYVAVLGRRSTQYGFQRIFNPFRATRIRLVDGSKRKSIICLLKILPTRFNAWKMANSYKATSQP